MFGHSLPVPALTCLSLVGCSSSASGVNAAGTFELGGNTHQTTVALTGGTPAQSTVGGMTATPTVGLSGGLPAAGGVHSTAPAVIIGGKTSTGGAAAAGGNVGIGGSVPPGGGSAEAGYTSGGKSPIGSSAQSTGGGAAGGNSATGGVAAIGGALTGGVAPTGGALATGGSTSSTASTGAAETKPLGYGQATTGCGSTSYQEAATLANIQSLIDAYSGTGGLCIKYTGKFDSASISDPCTQHTLAAQTLEIKKKSDITIMGVDGSAANFGIHIASSSSNVIIRNMVFALLPGGGDSDAISIEGMSGGVPTNIWIDHNELYSSLVECPGAGDTSFDGLIDAKKGADNITVSYNYIHDHHKVSLNGYSDSDDLVRHITFHHNIFENVGSRTPLQRNGYSHLLSNYFNQITVSGANIRMGYSLIESNYFENSKNPVTSRDSTELGYWELRANNVMSPSDFSVYNITWAASDSTPTKDATDWTTTATYPVALGYTYTADPPQCVKNGLRNVAGAAKGLATLKCN